MTRIRIDTDHTHDTARCLISEGDHLTEMGERLDQRHPCTAARTLKGMIK